MGKKKSTLQSTVRAMRRSSWLARVQEMREGRRERAQTFVDRKKEASRTACRKRPID